MTDFWDIPDENSYYLLPEKELFIADIGAPYLNKSSEIIGVKKENGNDIVPSGLFPRRFLSSAKPAGHHAKVWAHRRGKSHHYWK